VPPAGDDRITSAFSLDDVEASFNGLRATRAGRQDTRARGWSPLRATSQVKTFAGAPRTFMDNTGHMHKPGPLQRPVEMGVAIAMILLGVVVIVGALQVGIGWGAEGPRSGFFPFYLGLIIIATSAVNLVRANLIPRGKLFAEWEQLAQVWAVVIPTAIYVGVMPWTGLYLASIVLITYFMIRLGRYSLHFSGGIAVAVLVGVYFTFERWFLVPLPKGPIEDFFGL
jgi:hypothetical protein